VAALSGIVALALHITACAPPGPTPAEISAATGLARLHTVEGEHEQAVRIYRELLAASDDAPFVRLGLAAALFQKGDLAAAAAEYRRILAEEADSPIALYNMARTLERQGRKAEAAVFAQHFVSLHGAELPALAAKAQQMMQPERPPGPATNAPPVRPRLDTRNSTPETEPTE